MDLLTSLALAITLAVPGRSNATPSIASAGSFVLVAWSASEPSGVTDIYVSTSRDAARTFDAPVRVNHVAGNAGANGEQPPRIALAPRASGDPEITIVWTAKGTNGTTILWSRSQDGGRSFAAATSVPGSDAPGNRGWHNASADRSGRVYAVWLDHRELARDESAAFTHHQHVAGKPDGVAMAQKSKLFVASLDGSVPAHAVGGGVCYCCKTALATGADGALYAAWRHVYPGNLRDIAFAMSRDGGRTFGDPVRVSEDRWRIEGCPDDGPALGVDGSGRVHVIWPTLVSEHGGEPTIALFYAVSADGRTFSERVRLPTRGMPHHPQIAVASDGSLTAAWDEVERGARRAIVASASASSIAAPRFNRTVVGEGAAVYPVVVRAGDATVAAWTEKASAGSVIAVRRIDAAR